MVYDLEDIAFEHQVVWRIGHAPTPWRFTDWAHADQHGRFDGRWDDPDGSYRVLYASISRFGAFVEALGDFRTDPELAAGLKDIVSDDEERGVPPGHLPVSWLRGRVVGEAAVAARCAQVGHSRSLAFLRKELATISTCWPTCRVRQRKSTSSTRSPKTSPCRSPQPAATSGPAR